MKRTEKLINDTLNNLSKKQFKAADLLISSITYEEDKTHILVMFLSGLMGFFIGVIYLFTRNFYNNND